MKIIFTISIIMIIISAFLLLISRHVGRIILYSIYILGIFLSYLTLKPKGFICNSILVLFLLIITCLYLFIQNKIKYDFMDKIYTIKYFINSLIFKPKLNPKNNSNDNNIKNSKDITIIGKVIPYNNYQLKYNGKFITMNDISNAGGILISGAAGSGKTYQLKSLTKQNIINGQSVIFCDYKGDPEVSNELINFAKNYNYDIYNLSCGSVNFNYDPLQNLNNVGRIEAIMNMRKWDLSGADGHYKTGTQLLLQRTIGDFSHVWDSSKSYTYEYYQYMKKYSPARDEWDSYSTVNKLLELLITSELEPMFLGKNNKVLNFKEIKDKKFLLIVSFVSSNKELATSFSSLLFRDLLDEYTVNPSNRNINLKIDEFATLDNPFIIKDLLEKGRSAKISTTLALQDINQVIIQTNEAYLNSILGTINTFIIFAGGTRNTAEKFAGVQLHDIEPILMNLRKPFNGKKPTAMYISKYPSLNKKTNSEVFRFEPYIYKGGLKQNLNKNKAENDFKVLDVMYKDNSKMKNEFEDNNNNNDDNNFSKKEYSTKDNLQEIKEDKEEITKMFDDLI